MLRDPIAAIAQGITVLCQREGLPNRDVLSFAFRGGGLIENR